KKPASGKVCKCKNPQKLSEKFEDGSVLVMESTSNDVLEYMRRAAAIVVEEPGKNNHAAIVGLTLEIPVIVNAKNAMALLEDGKKVTVDSERGIVHR
ncbi:MAG: PEP-utilizing enzyme, partial [Anaerovoracaceae bacterium]